MRGRKPWLCSLFFGVKFQSFAFKTLRLCIVGGAAAGAFFAIAAAAIATAAFALADRRINPAAKVICSRNYAQYDDNQLNIHVFTSCFPQNSLRRMGDVHVVCSYGK